MEQAKTKKKLSLATQIFIALVLGIIVTVVREVLASRKYRMPDEYYE